MLKQFLKKRPELDNKTILVTGGTGSFGHEFLSYVLKHYKPKKLIVFSRDELKQYEMAQKFSPQTHECLRYFIGDVRDYNRLEMAFSGVDIVIHAAALKHVPIAEYNPFECIHTNVIGAENVVRAAIRNNVKHVVALSTDKAVSPINLYGASKLAAEKIFVAANNLSGDGGTRFSVVRYGNVVGSRGSVVPLFKRMAQETDAIMPITDEKMTRFWITLEQGVAFVLSSLDMMQGGEIYIPKIPSMKIIDLAKAIAPNHKIKVIGIRPGEKLHECMLTADEASDAIELSDRYVIEPRHLIGIYKILEAPKVMDRFCYSSDTNHEWLTQEQLYQIIQ